MGNIFMSEIKNLFEMSDKVYFVCNWNISELTFHLTEQDV